ncbi:MULTISPECIES: SDR family NAD(P)-dependent oxidoreductase [Methylobacterium]|uniref:SDR family NAD(P)-dependent oxidoreductase n=1 Tax=Methylobacterium TaxID=407 RepID=UPI0013ED06B7|nr:SDR family oxidoreductase [Methylobacterium sp. DB0501]NGM38065.1 SDR family oxidoreductase [Methylobacterium sp. DB0501]
MRALVTGASSGIGAAIVARLLGQGWQVTGVSRGAGGPAHPRYRHLPLDLSDLDAIAPAIGALRVDALVHAAGLLRVGRLGETAPEDGAAGDSAAMWRLHVEAAARLADLLVPRMEAGGRVVLIGSRTATGAAGRGAYAASKAALIGLARSWAAELMPRGITVNVVAPAATETPMLTDPSRTGVTPKLPPLGRFIRPEEVAAAVAYFLSPDAGVVTGQNLVICGGSSL